MILIDLDDRLVAIDADATKGFLWKDGGWHEASPTLVLKAWSEGATITPERAAHIFPKADLGSLPRL